MSGNLLRGRITLVKDKVREGRWKEAKKCQRTWLPLMGGATIEPVIDWLEILVQR